MAADRAKGNAGAGPLHVRNARRSASLGLRPRAHGQPEPFFQDARPLLVPARAPPRLAHGVWMIPEATSIANRSSRTWD